MPRRRDRDADEPLRAIMLDLREHAYRLRRDTPVGATFARGMAAGLRSAANSIGDEIEDPVTLEAGHRCRCVGQGECTACELLWLAHDTTALLRLADDRCACEQERECDACAVAREARKHPTTPAGIRRPADDAGAVPPGGVAVPASVEESEHA